MEGGVGPATVRFWRRSSSWLPLAVRGASFHQSSARPGRRSTGGSPSGARIGSGPGSTVWSWTNWGRAVSWTGRGAQSTRSASGRQKRASDGTESDRPGQLGIENPSGHRPERTALVIGHPGANMHDSQGMEPLICGIPPVRSRRGPRRRRPAKLHADKGYDYVHLRRWLCGRGIRHRIARRGVESSQRLGRHRRVVERTVSWLAGCRRLYRRYERKPEHFLAFVGIAATLICHRRLTK